MVAANTMTGFLYNDDSAFFQGLSGFHQHFFLTIHDMRRSGIMKPEKNDAHETTAG